MPELRGGRQIPTWDTEALGFRGQLDWFELDIDRNEDGDAVDASESAIYNFEPPQSDHGPTLVYVNQKALDSGQDDLIMRRGEPENKYDLTANPLRNNKEDRIYDVMFKLSGTVTDEFNALYHINDGTNLSLPLDIRKMLYKRWEPALLHSRWRLGSIGRAGACWSDSERPAGSTILTQQLQSRS